MKNEKDKKMKWDWMPIDVENRMVGDTRLVRYAVVADDKASAIDALAESRRMEQWLKASRNLCNISISIQDGPRGSSVFYFDICVNLCPSVEKK